MGYYTTEERVGLRLRTNFNAATLPTAGEVEEIIAEVEARIDELAGRTYRASQTATNEYHDYTGAGLIIVKNPGLLTVTSIEYTEDGGSSWSTLSASNYDIYTDFDTVEFKQNVTTGEVVGLPQGAKTIRITYTYGKTSVPLTIRQLATDMAALEVIRTQVNSTANTAGGEVQVGPIRVTEPGAFSVSFVTSMQRSIDERLHGMAGAKLRTTVTKRWD